MGPPNIIFLQANLLMIKKKKILCIIPARGGSKTIKNKNLLKLGNLTLIEHAIKYAKTYKHFDNIILNSDSKKILKIGKKYNIDIFKRKKKYSSDKSLIAFTIHETLNFFKKKNIFFDIVVLLEPTCPFRKIDHLKKCINILVNKKIDSISTFSKAPLNPNRAWKMKNRKPYTYFKNTIPWNSKQSFMEAYQLNGSIYAFYTKNFDPKNKSLLFGKQRAFICDDQEILIDIDNKKDYLMAKIYYEYEKKRY